MNAHSWRFARRPFFVQCLSTLFCVALLKSASAQLVADGATNSLSNVTNNGPTVVTIGTNGSFTLLVLSNNTLLQNSSYAVIGRNASAQSNEVRLVSPTARWVTASFGELYVGSNGPANRLTVSGGGSVENYSGVVGTGASSTNNSVLVTDPGSLWYSFLLFLGSGGGFNQLVVSNGATLWDSSAFMGGATVASNNVATITGAGSLWTNEASFFLGSGSPGNRVRVDSGGRLVCTGGFVGWGSSNNTILVSDNGSSWNNRGELSVGGTTSGNQVTVSNGAMLRVDGSVTIGEATNANLNVVTITGAGSQWLVATNIIVGTNGAFNRLVISDGALVTNHLTRIGEWEPAVSNEVVVAGSVWSMSGAVEVGVRGRGTRLTISNGAVVKSVSGSVGGSLQSSNNTVVISDPGSAWTNQSGFSLGHNSAFNRLVITNGGRLHTAGSAVGNFNTATNNVAVISGTGSAWNNLGGFEVGVFARSNRLTLEGGGTLTASDVIVGDAASASNNVAVVSGAGSQLSSRTNVIVGNSSAGNQLIVSNGAALYAGADGVLGFNSGVHSNFVLVTGAGSLWSNQYSFVVGRSGAGNRLVVSNGALVRNLFGPCLIGQTVSGSNNEVMVTGPGSSWDIPGLSFTVGSSGGGNRLVVGDGGLIRSAFTQIGSSSSNNEMWVTGPGTLATNSNSLTVGDGAGGNRLVVSNAALAVAGAGIIVGNQSSSSNNRVVVHGGTLRATNNLGTGTLDARRGTNVLNAGLIDVDVLLLTNTLSRFEFNGGTLLTRGATISNGNPFIVGNSGTTPAVWDVRAGVTNTFVDGDIAIGTNSSFNQLILTNGALLTGSGFIVTSQQATSRSNRVTVAGAGSRVRLAAGITVGSAGSDNRMVVSDGATITNESFSSIGYLPSATNNELILTGPGTSWVAGFSLAVGSSGSGNRLLVSDGALMTSAEGHIGASLLGSNNLALVGGAGSRWDIGSELRVGEFDVGNQLIVTNGATVTVGQKLFVGLDPASINNRVVVDNATLRVTNASATALLEIRRGTNVLNAGLIETDILRVTNLSASRFEFNSGTLSMKSSRISLAVPFKIGNGVSPAMLNLAGNGLHEMPSTLGLVISSNATLTGNGTLAVVLQVLPGGSVSPGASVGKLVLSNSPSLQGAIVMELSKNGEVLTNDQVQVTDGLTYGSTLTVSNLGPTALAVGDSFQLFSATSYSGAFTSITLPPLPSPLFWKNNLLVNGSLEVAAPPAIALSSGSYTQNFDSLALSGTQNLWRDNSTLLGWYAAKTVLPNAITNYIAEDGSFGGGALYSFGSTGSGERALGSVASGTSGDIGYAVVFTNDTGSSVSDFFITYTGEQWRNGGGAANTLTFWHRVSPSVVTSSDFAALTNWTAVTNLDFAAPSAVTPTGFALDGNLAKNRQVFSSVLVSGLTVPPGQNVFFRWYDEDSPGTDQGMAVDDLLVTFAPVLPRITAVSVTTNGFIKLTGLGESNRLFGIETTTNLTPPISWQLLFTNTTDTNSLIQFTDTNAPTFPVRFYRAWVR